jgi:hypothetical protein
VALLEKEMQALRDLPARVTSLEGQFLQFRAEVRDEFSATRREIREVDKKVDTRIDELGAEMRMLFENAIDRIKNIQHG